MNNNIIYIYSYLYSYYIDILDSYTILVYLSTTVIPITVK